MAKHMYRVVGYHKDDVLATDLKTFWIDIESEVNSTQALLDADLDFVIDLADKNWGADNWYEVEFRDPNNYSMDSVLKGTPLKLRKSIFGE